MWWEQESRVQVDTQFADFYKCVWNEASTHIKMKVSHFCRQNFGSHNQEFNFIVLYFEKVGWNSDVIQPVDTNQRRELIGQFVAEIQ